MRLLLVLLVLAGEAAAATKPPTRASIRGVERKRVVERGAGDAITFSWAPADGTGLPSIGELCASASAEMTGSSWCLKGDGTTLAGSVAVSPTGSPVQQSLATCPNGPDCAAVNVESTPTSSDYFSTASVASPTGDFSVCWLGRAHRPASSYVDLIGRYSGGTGNSFYLEVGSTGLIDFTIFKTAGSFTVANSGTTTANDVRHFICATYDYVTDGTSVMRVYLDGTQVDSRTSAVGPVQANTQVTKINNGALSVCVGCLLEGAFFTEKVVDAATIASLARTVLADTPKSTQGQLVTMTRTTTKFCAKSDQTAGTLLPPGRICIRNSGLSVAGASTNVATNSQVFGSWSQDTTGGTLTLTNNVCTAPDGTLTAERLQLGAVTAAKETYLYQGPTGTAAAWSQSLYVKAYPGAGTQTVYSMAYDGTSYFAVACTAGESAWVRCTMDNKTLTAVTWYYLIGIDRREASQTAVAGPVDMCIWGAQREARAASTSYIATVGSTVVRNGETASFSPLPVLPLKEGCARATFVPYWSGTPPAGLYVLGFNVAASARVVALNAGFDGIYINNQVSDAQAAIATNITFTNGTAITTRSSWSATANLKRLSFTPGSPSVSTKSFDTMGALDGTMQVVYSPGGIAPETILQSAIIGTNTNLCGSTP